MTFTLEYGRIPSSPVTPDELEAAGEETTALLAKLGPELIDLVIQGGRFAHELEDMGVKVARHGLRNDGQDIVYVLEFLEQHDLTAAQFVR